MKLMTFSNGDELHHYKKTLVLVFGGERHVLSTGPNNGGFRTDLQAVFNNDMNPGPGMAVRLRADTYSGHMDLLAWDDLGLDPAHCSGLGTSADMENVSIKSMSFDDFTVTAIVTGGIKNNGGRVGDPASWHESSGKAGEVKHGTINIMLHIDVNLDSGTLARAMVTATEAKTAVLQELLAPSRYSSGIATGSGTDGIMVICDPESEVTLTNAGKHTKLGEYIGRCVMAAVREALDKQSGLNPDYQHDIINRLDRFGMTEDSLWIKYNKKYNKAGELSRARFTDRLDRIKKGQGLVTWISLYAHLLDQLNWGMLSEEEVDLAGRTIREQISGLYEVAFSSTGVEEADNLTDRMMDQIQNLVLGIIENTSDR